MKERSKTNPFIGLLRPDEEILWLYVPSRLTFGLHLRSSIVMITTGFVCIIGVLTLLQVLMDSAATVSRLNSLRESWLTVGWKLFLKNLTQFAFQTVFAFVVSYRFFWLLYKRSNPAYALTNQRLLHHKSGIINVLPLENLQDMKLESPSALLFTGLPTWNDVEGADKVMKLIEQAREDRMIALSQDQVADAYESMEENIGLENEALSKRTEARYGRK